MNSRRKGLQKLHAKLPIDSDEDVIMLGAENVGDEVITKANFADLCITKDNNSADMKKKIHHTKMKNEAYEMGNGVHVNVTTEESLDTKGQTRRTPTFSRTASSYFTDGKRLIDFVLAYEPKNDSVENADDGDTIVPSSGKARNAQTHWDKRRIFEANLQKLGLELEYATACQGNVKFVLIHAPFKILLKQAELLMIRMPVHRNDVRKEVNLMDGCINAFLKRIKFLDFKELVRTRIQPDEYFCQPFVAQHLECFVGWQNPDTFFSRADRARMVHDLLIRARYDRGDNMDKLRFGIERLVRNNTYSAAYPIHEELDKSMKSVNFSTCSDRQLLYETWVKLKNLIKYQPLDLIQKYYGTKIAFYFAWLGFYTRCLYPVSLLGILCVIYGLWSMGDDIPSNDICHGSDDSVSQELLCPACEKYCDFIPLNNTCLYSKATYVFDNYATIGFTIIMSLWMTVFLELWKRYHAELAYKWNVLGYEPDEEVVRPEFQYRRAKMKINPVTKQEEPYISITEKALRLCGSAVTVLFFISLVVALLFGIVVYRVIVRQVFYASEGSQFVQSQAVIFTSATAATINLLFILIMNYFYNKLALKLTNWECPRTQSEFDNSYTFKVFLFQFVNFYASLFYIAFVKGRFAGIPGHPTDYADPHEVRIGNIRLEQCEAAGCMVELLIQLIVIMVGKQAINGFIEMAYPMFCYWFRRWRLNLPETKRQKLERISKQRRKTIKERPGVSLYEQDYMLNPVYQQFLFDEYLEMVIQLGFCSLFVAAFPLAPLFALVNNIFEIRFDAYKFIVTTRRPVPEQARNIGVWLTIINMISNLAVLCNAFVIAFTSDFIPKLYYQITQGTLHGYINDTLAYFDATSFAAHSQYSQQIYCRYWDLRRPPCSLAYNYPEKFGEMQEFCSDNYEFTYIWWIVLAFRLAFVLLFELTVLSIKAIFAYMIPDMPTKIIKQLQRERFLMRQAILQRVDSPEDDIEFARIDANIVSDVIEEPQNTDRPDLDNEFRRNTIDTISYRPGLDIPLEYRANSFTTTPEFDGLKRMYSRRERPSLSPRASPHTSHADLTMIEVEDPQEQTSASDPAIHHEKKKSTRRWPTPSLLVVPPNTAAFRRPLTIEVLQQPSQHMEEADDQSG